MTVTDDERAPLPTGVDIIDRKLGGGIPPGTVTVLSAQSASQSELFLYDFAKTRRTAYLSTIRTGDAILEVLESRNVDPATVEVIRIDDSDPIADARSVLSELGDGVNAIVDPIDVLETAGGTDYRRFLTELKHSVTGTSSTVVLHCLDDEPTPDNRRNTVHVADLVFKLSTEVKGDSIVNQLSVPKFRNGESIADVIKLDLTSEVDVDMTRNIM